MIPMKYCTDVFDPFVQKKQKGIQLLALFLISFTVRECSGGKTHESSVTSFTTGLISTGESGWSQRGDEIPSDHNTGGERWRGGGGHDTRKGRSIPEEGEVVMVMMEICYYWCWWWW